MTKVTAPRPDVHVIYRGRLPARPSNKIERTTDRTLERKPQSKKVRDT
jgi:hypothetical protein